MGPFVALLAFASFLVSAGSFCFEAKASIDRFGSRRKSLEASHATSYLQARARNLKSDDYSVYVDSAPDNDGFPRLSARSLQNGPFSGLNRLAKRRAVLAFEGVDSTPYPSSDDQTTQSDEVNPFARLLQTVPSNPPDVGYHFNEKPPSILKKASDLVTQLEMGPLNVERFLQSESQSLTAHDTRMSGKANLAELDNLYNPASELVSSIARSLQESTIPDLTQVEKDAVASFGLPDPSHDASQFLRAFSDLASRASTAPFATATTRALQSPMELLTSAEKKSLAQLQLPDPGDEPQAFLRRMAEIAAEAATP